RPGDPRQEDREPRALHEDPAEAVRPAQAAPRRERRPLPPALREESPREEEAGGAVPEEPPDAPPPLHPLLFQAEGRRGLLRAGRGVPAEILEIRPQAPDRPRGQGVRHQDARTPAALLARCRGLRGDEQEPPPLAEGSAQGK